MTLDLIYLEAGGQLYAGYGLNGPVLKWNGTYWHTYEAVGPKADDWAVRLSRKEADRCFSGSGTAAWPPGFPAAKEFPVDEMMRLRPDLFDSYDGRNLRRSPEEEEALYENMLPQRLRDARAKRRG